MSNYDPFLDPYMAKKWLCLTCDAKLNFESLKSHMTKTSHMDFLRDTYLPTLYPETLDPEWNDKSEQRKAFETTVKKIAMNIQLITTGNSMKLLDGHLKNTDCIIIGAGPSLTANNHLKILAESNFKGAIILTDRSLKPALEAGVTPDKFQIFVNTLDDKDAILPRFYDHDIVKKWIDKISFLFAININHSLVEWAEIHGAPVYWYHPMRDFNNPNEPSFDAIFRLMFAALGQQPLPMISDGGNVGTCSFMLAHRVLKACRVILLGMDLSIKGDQKYEIEEIENLKKQQGQFDYYRKAFYHILKEYHEAEVINCTEGGSLSDPRLKSISFMEYLNG